MKRTINLSSICLIMALLVFNCEEYLDIPPEAAITEDQVFGVYQNFQGFQDQLLKNLVDFNRHGARVTHAIGGEALSPSGQSVYNGNIGNYFYILGNRGIYAPAELDAFEAGLYSNMWENIRMANLCIEKIDAGSLANGTQQERDWIKGQALFFRGYYYYEYVRSFGSVPYFDEVISSENQNMMRNWTYEKNGKTYRNTQACFERIVEDFQEASTLLPTVWPIPNVNYGRPTSISALGYKAKALQFSASPLFNEEATGTLVYDKELLDRCAQACIETIDLAVSVRNQKPPEMLAELNADGLTRWIDHRTTFATKSGSQPGTPEVLLSRPSAVFGANAVRQSEARNWSVAQLTGQKAAQGSQMYLDKFEMSDGSRYKLENDLDPDKRWVNRDPRFKFTFYVHNDRVDVITLNFSTVKLAGDGALNSNAMRKFMEDDVTKDNYENANYSTPLLRLADIYLTYAEAVYESTGSYTASAPGTGLTAEEAVNKVRSRAGQPNVATTLPFYTDALPESCELATDSPFRLLYRNERHVELAYEGVYWFDIRRWKRAALKDGTQIQALNFDIDGSNNVIESSVTRADRQVFVFKDQHYWMPFDTDLTRFSTDWQQNPGW